VGVLASVRSVGPSDHFPLSRRVSHAISDLELRGKNADGARRERCRVLVGKNSAPQLFMLVVKRSCSALNRLKSSSDGVVIRMGTSTRVILEEPVPRWFEMACHRMLKT